ncbi:MAG: ATP adenylyltransferase [Alteromonas naphthalenivorans]|jgi:ATP adenylyltransferase
MKVLYAPWRENYTTTSARSPKGADNKSEDECVFCEQLKDDKDTEHFILGRFKHSYVVLNRYPYSGGHLLILPLDHKAKLTDLSSEARTEIMGLITQSTSALEKELDAKGINVGLNQGKAAGAGLPSHLHFHVVPRWLGDTNFMPIIGQTKIVSTNLKDIFTKLKPYF